MSHNDREPSSLEVPEVPEVPDHLLLPVRCLAGAAYTYHGVFLQAVEGKPIQEILEERGEWLLLAEKVIDAWATSLEIGEDE